MTHRFAGALVAATLLVFLSTVSVFAHAELVESDPADGETIQTPYTLFALFSQEMDPNRQRSFIRVLNADGIEVASGGVHPDDPTQMFAELPLLEPGEYTVRWQTTTPDDNGVERGTYAFDVIPPALPTDGGNSPLPTATPGPTATPARTSAPLATASQAPSQGPEPTATPINPVGQLPTGGNDVVLALVIAGVVIAAIALFLFARSRR